MPSDNLSIGQQQAVTYHKYDQWTSRVGRSFTSRTALQTRDGSKFHRRPKKSRALPRALGRNNSKVVFLFGLLSMDCGLKPRTEAIARVMCSAEETEALQKPDPLRTYFPARCPSFAVAGRVPVPTIESQEAFSPLPAEIIKGVSCSINRSQSSTAEKLPVHLSSSPGMPPVILRGPETIWPKSDRRADQR
jgi:hypothetical protein